MPTAEFDRLQNHILMPYQIIDNTTAAEASKQLTTCSLKAWACFHTRRINIVHRRNPLGLLNTVVYVLIHTVIMFLKNKINKKLSVVAILRQ